MDVRHEIAAALSLLAMTCCVDASCLAVHARLGPNRLELGDHTAVRQRAIRIRELKERHFRAAEREGITVVIGVTIELETEGFELLIEGVVTDERQRANSGHIERRGERLPKRNAALEI